MVFAKAATEFGGGGWALAVLAHGAEVASLGRSGTLPACDKESVIEIRRAQLDGKLGVTKGDLFFPRLLLTEYVHKPEGSTHTRPLLRGL